MIKTKYIFTVIILGVLLSGCVTDTLMDNPGNIPDGMARLSVGLNTPSGSVVSTRSKASAATEQDLTGNVVVMVCDNNDPKIAKLKQPPVLGTVNSGNTLTALLLAEKTDSYICIAANISNANKDYLLGLAAGVAMTQVNARLELTATEAGLSSPLPMSGWSEKIAQIAKNSTSSISVSLLRSVGRIDVDGTTADFTVHGVQLVNGAKKGWLLPQEALPYFGETDVIGSSMSSLETPSTYFTEKLYCFENAGMRGNTYNVTRVVIKGQRKGASSPSYYAIEIVYKETGSTNKERYDIERNKIYTIRLNKVDKDGYASYEEASKSEAFNNQLESNIVVTDPYAYNIVTNGKQYMGVTNSEFVLYPINSSDAASDLLAATLSYTCDPGWSEGTITPPPGISLVTGQLAVQHGSVPLYRDIIIKSIAPGFTEGVIVAHIGNLRQEIKVTVKAPTQAIGQIIDNYFVAPNEAEDYKVGEIISPTPETAWLKVSSSPLDEGASSLNDKITHPAGGIYVHVLPNIGFAESAHPREASLFVSGSEDSQRVRIYVQQDKFDIYSGNIQIKPFTYVGTFHRWNQTAERLIRIDASQSLGGGTNVWWQATVVSGREYIVLSTEISKDGGINCVNNPLGVGDNPRYATDESVEANCQVNSTLRTVSGTGSYIYFKVGLTGRLRGASAEPRYGLIAITYGSGSTVYGTHNIYVRQGEAADYLMRPWDAVTDPINPDPTQPSRPAEFLSPRRPKAVKFGVYNLTDPAPSGDVVELGPRGYNFVQYPTQGGYYFTASGTQAIKPTVRYPVTTALANPPEFDTDNPWLTAWETCPRGYRRPDDGVGRLAGGETNTGEVSDIVNSEVRQSLWLFPMGGVSRSDFSNQIQGYLADGFFDRRPIVQFEETGSLPSGMGMTHGVVAEKSVNAAYWGFLIFNPHTYASVFMPLSGFYSDRDGGVMLRQGVFGFFHTKTPGAGSNDGWLVTSGYFVGIEGDLKSDYSFTLYQNSSAKSGAPIRCVKDEQPSVGTDDPQVEKPSEGGISMVVNLTYATTDQSIEQLITNKYTSEQIKRTNTIAINAQKAFTTADYQYLNVWASKSDHQLRHLVIRGENVIPANAFTSSGWYTISLIDAKEIKSGAFASSLDGLKELSLPYLDAITVEQGAFAFTTTKVQLFLNGTEYGNRNDKEWKSHTWKGIKKY